jgi:hypothetical protein
MEGLVKIIEEYHRYRKHLFEKSKSKPQFDPKVFLERGGS